MSLSYSTKHLLYFTYFWCTQYSITWTFHDWLSPTSYSLSFNSFAICLFHSPMTFSLPLHPCTSLLYYERHLVSNLYVWTTSCNNKHLRPLMIYFSFVWMMRLIVPIDVESIILCHDDDDDNIALPALNTININISHCCVRSHWSCRSPPKTPPTYLMLMERTMLPPLLPLLMLLLLQLLLLMTRSMHMAMIIIGARSQRGS